MSGRGGRSILGEIGRQVIDMLDEASRELTQPPYARPEDRPARDRPRPTPPWEVEREPAPSRAETARVDEAEPERPRQREPAPVARPVRPGRSIQAQLQSKSAVRRALVMNEILGPPKSMSDNPFP